MTLFIVMGIIGLLLVGMLIYLGITCCSDTSPGESNDLCSNKEQKKDDKSENKEDKKEGDEKAEEPKDEEKKEAE